MNQSESGSVDAELTATIASSSPIMAAEWWNANQAIAWVMLRDPQWVAAADPQGLDEDKGSVLVRLANADGEIEEIQFNQKNQSWGDIGTRARRLSAEGYQIASPHPGVSQCDLIARCREGKITVQARSPVDGELYILSSEQLGKMELHLDMAEIETTLSETLPPTSSTAWTEIAFAREAVIAEFPASASLNAKRFTDPFTLAWWPFQGAQAWIMTRQRRAVRHIAAFVGNESIENDGFLELVRFANSPEAWVRRRSTGHKAADIGLKAFQFDENCMMSFDEAEAALLEAMKARQLECHAVNGATEAPEIVPVQMLHFMAPYVDHNRFYLARYSAMVRRLPEWEAPMVEREKVMALWPAPTLPELTDQQLDMLQVADDTAENAEPAARPRKKELNREDRQRKIKLERIVGKIDASFADRAHLPSATEMAKDVYASIGKAEGVSVETIRQIVTGRYSTLYSLGVAPPRVTARLKASK